MNNKQNWYLNNNPKVSSRKRVIILLSLTILIGFFYFKFMKKSSISSQKMINSPISTTPPEWNLSTLFHSTKDPNFQITMDDISKNVHLFEIKYLKNKSFLYSSDDFFNSMQLYDSIAKNLYKLNLYSNLLISKDSSNLEYVNFYSEIKNFSTKINIKLLEFPLILSKLSQKKMNFLLKSKKNKKYTFFLQNLVKNKKHILQKEIEKYSLDKSSALDSAIVKFYDTKISSISINIDNKEYPLGIALDMLSYSEDKKIRDKIANLLSTEFDKKAEDVLFVYNTLFKSKKIDDSYRKYKSPVEAENISNHISQKTLDNLVNSVTSNYENTVHRYYKIKAKYLGMKNIEYSDRSVPIVNLKKNFNWNDAQKISLDLYKDFDQNAYKIIKEIFDKNKIDALATKSKYSGGFCTVYNPFILLNYNNNISNISDLTHELGHALQMTLSAKNGFILGTGVPLALAEIPSTFSEILLQKKIISEAKTKNEKILALSNQIEHNIRYIINPISMHVFEYKLHSIIKDRDLTLEEVKNIWMDTLRQSSGPNVVISDIYKNYWTRVSHFVHHSFYVYSYAFSKLISLALFDQYESNKKDFTRRYLHFLQNMTNESTPVLLKTMNIKINNKNIWNIGMKKIEQMIDELEEEINKK